MYYYLVLVLRFQLGIAGWRVPVVAVCLSAFAFVLFFPIIGLWAHHVTVQLIDVKAV